MHVNDTSSIQEPKKSKPKIKCTQTKMKKKCVQYDTEIEQANSEREANSKLPSQTSKGGLIQRFGEDIGYLVLGSNMVKLDIPFFLVVFQKVVSHIYVFGFGVEHGVFGNTNGTRATTKKRHSRKAQTKITQSISHPEKLRATASGSNIFSFNC